MKKTVRLTESDLVLLVKRVVQEQQEEEIFGTHPSFGKETYVDAMDRKVGSEIEFSDVREFGPEDYKSFMEYINNCDTRWCIKTKQNYDKFASMGTIKIGKGTRKLSEQDDEESQSMMDVSSDSSWHQMRKREVPIAQVDLSRILSIAKRWCVGKENLPDCQRVNELYLKHYL